MNSVCVQRPLPGDYVEMLLPLMDGVVPAGFPSPAEDFTHARIDLNQTLIQHPTCSFLMRARGWSMLKAGIHDNDLLVVDRVLKPLHGDIVVAVLDTDFTCKRLFSKAGVVKLCAENPDYPDIWPSPEQTLEIWGIVTSSITIHRSFRHVRAS